jgi:hypothetical protein
MKKIRQPLTMCGLQTARTELFSGRAKVISRDGNKLTFRWPCGYEKTETIMVGVGKLRRPMSADMVAFFSRYWANGVTYECPRCRRAAARRNGRPPSQS